MVHGGLPTNNKGSSNLICAKSSSVQSRLVKSHAPLPDGRSTLVAAENRAWSRDAVRNGMPFSGLSIGSANPGGNT
eukprot:12881978-Prorocentrum_lima.AAC.1